MELLKEWLRVEASGYWDFPWRAFLSHRDVVNQLPEPLRSRVLFTLEMEESTEEAVAVLKSEMPPLEKLKRIGEVMTRQHWLLSKLYEVSLPQLDRLVERALAAGAYGAKLSGAGLGGVVVALASDVHMAQRIVKEGHPRGGLWKWIGAWSMEIRKNPLTGEYTLVSPHRLSRPWQPEGFCPFCPGAPETGHGWDVLLLPNRYPVVSPTPPRPYTEDFYVAQEAYGRAYVLVETPQHDVDDLSDLPIGQIVKALKPVVEAARESERDERLAYFFYFRNKGREIGVSLTHPHSQIYVLPVVPPRVALELAHSKRWYKRRGKCLHCAIVKRKDKCVIYENGMWKSFTPYYARWPFEAHVYPKRHVSSIVELSEDELVDLADALKKKTLCAFKNALEKPMPYIMVMHQAPSA